MPSWTRDEQGTSVLNVDLDIYSRSSLKSLVEAFGKPVSVLYVGWEGGRHGAHLEMAGRSDLAADRLIRLFVRLVKRLPRPARKLWDDALSRTFNIGVQGGIRPHRHTLVVREKTVAQVAEVGASIVVTTYAARVSAGTRSRSAGRRASTSRPTMRCS
jgi:hypothetical protein